MFVHGIQCRLGNQLVLIVALAAIVLCAGVHAHGSVHSNPPLVSFAMPELPPDEKILAAIAEVETGNRPHAKGREGEISRFQILPTTWRRYSQLLPAEGAHRPEEADRVARAHLQHLKEALVRQGKPLTVFMLAAAWNAGPERTRYPQGTLDYANRVSNLVEERP